MMRKYLCLYPDVFVWYKKNEVLIYNSQNGQGFKYKTTTINDIIELLVNTENLYCIELNNLEKTKNQEFKKFIDKIIEHKTGEVIEIQKNKHKPIRLPPILNLQSDIKRLADMSSGFVGENILIYLHEITIHLNVLSGKDGRIQNIKLQQVTDLIESLDQSLLSNIHIKGENIFRFPDLMILFNLLAKTPIKKSLYINQKNLNSKNISLINSLDNKFSLTYILNDFTNLGETEKCIETIKKEGIIFKYLFKIQNEKEYNLVDSLIKKHQLDETEIRTVFTGTNIGFFKDYIFLSEEDILASGLNRREIFAQQALNTYDFGKLTYMPNGKVYANPYFSPIGTIGDDICSLIYKELTSGQSWLRIRDMRPCNSCIYQWLCPSPSNFELEIGKPNLCHFIF